MRFLILSIEYPPIGGGASPVIHEINKEFVSRGHQVTVVTMAYKGLSAFEFIDGIEIHRVNSFRVHKHLSRVWEHVFYLAAARRALRKLISTHQFDFCFTHFVLPTGILATWLWKKYKLPYSLTSHGSDIPGFNPDRFRFMHRFTPALIRRIIQHASAVTTPSNYLRQLILDMGGMDEGKFRVIPNGVDTALYTPGNKKPIVVSTGRLLARKGFQHLIEAVAYESFPLEVHICGDGPMMASLREQAAESKTPIHFHGWLDNTSESYRNLLAEAKFFSLVSGKENASISLLEALSAGCVVITSNVSGCPESVGDAGICIAPRDVHALRDVLRQLMADDQMCRSYMEQSRQRAITHYSWPAIADQYLSLVKPMS